jgi:hypothetical protein
MPSKNSEKHSWAWAFRVGFVLCLIQVFFTWIFAPKQPVPAQTYFRMVLLEGWDTTPGSNPIVTGYKRFNNWDSLRFFEIAQNGYHLPDRPLIEDDIHHYRANVTTPPAFPISVRIIQNLLNIRGEIALLVTGQLYSFVFWVYFLLFLAELNIPRKWILLGAISVAAHPSAFYMVLGYTESLFLASMMGLIYWTERWMRERKSGGSAYPPILAILAAAHGFLASATRIAGFPVIIYPVMRVLGEGVAQYKANRQSFKKLAFSLSGVGFGSLVITGIASFGLFSFFWFCYSKFGEWNLYFRISRMVGQEAKYFIIFDPRAYIPRFFFEDTMWSFNRSAVPLTLILGISALRLDVNWRKKFALYSTALILFYFAMTGKALSGMDGMTRYTLPVFVILILCWTQILAEKKFKLSKMQAAFIASGYLLSIAIQGWMAWRFLHGRWVS